MTSPATQLVWKTEFCCHISEGKFLDCGASDPLGLRSFEQELTFGSNRQRQRTDEYS